VRKLSSHYSAHRALANVELGKLGKAASSAVAADVDAADGPIAAAAASPRPPAHRPLLRVPRSKKPRRLVGVQTAKEGKEGVVDLRFPILGGSRAAAAGGGCGRRAAVRHKGMRGDDDDNETLPPFLRIHSSSL